MARIVRGGLIQTSVTHEGTAPLETIKQAMIDKHVALIEEAARKECQVVCLQELFYGPYFCAEQKAHWYAMTEPIPGGPTTQLMRDIAKHLGLVLIVPIYEVEGTGIYYNTAAVIDSDGQIRRLYLLRPSFPGRRALPWFERRRDGLQSLRHRRRLERIPLETRTTRSRRR